MTNLVCIVCPNSCKLEIDENLNVKGALCKRGEAFAKTELTAPMRTVTTTVKTDSAVMPVLPVKTDGEIPKSKIFELMRAAASVTAKGVVKMGDIIIRNAAGTGVNLVAAASVPKE